MSHSPDRPSDDAAENAAEGLQNSETEAGPEGRSPLVNSPFRRVISRVKASDFVSEVDYLAAVYAERKKEARKYSYRAFSEELGFGFTNYMHLIIAGHRHLTVKAAVKVAEGLGIAGKQKKFFLLLVQHKQEKDLGAREKAYAQLVETKKAAMVPGMEKDLLDYFSSWENSVILEILAQSGGKATEEEIASRLRPPVSSARVAQSIATLQSIGFLEPNAEGGFHIRTRSIATAKNVRSLALLRYHQSMLEWARESLTSVPGQLRDVSGVTMSVRFEDLQKIKEEIAEFRDQMLRKHDRAVEGSDVYQINIQLFPFTRPQEKKGD